MRHVGQERAVTVVLPEATVRNGARAAIRRQFDERHLVKPIGLEI